MQTTSYNDVKWKNFFSDYLSDVTKVTRHKWNVISDNTITDNNRCLYVQCEHCLKYLSLFTKNESAAIYLGNVQIAHVTGVIKPYGKLAICERLLIMS